MAKSRILTIVLASVAIFSVASLSAQEQSSLTVLKLVSPISDGTVFPFSLEGPGPDELFELGGGESETFPLDPGTYIVRETIPEGWELLQIRCGLLIVPGPVASGAVEIALEPGEELTCRFENNMVDVLPTPPPSILEIPMLSPTGLSLLMIAFVVAARILLRRAV